MGGNLLRRKNLTKNPCKRNPTENRSSARKNAAFLCLACFLNITACASVETPGTPAAEIEMIKQPEPSAEGIAGQNPEEENKAAAGQPEKNSGIPELELAVPEDNKLVNRYRNQYSSGDGLKYLSAVMKRSVPYRNFILAEIERLGAPGFLLYLPVIESGFSETAVSRSGAVGIWQFMKNSIGGYGIRINEWLDERRDPWLSTTAAIHKLMYNYEYLQDWNLALAAYNCGLGAVSRAVKKAGTKDYWELCENGYFKTETVNYVPKFLAIAEILSKSEELGIDWGEAAEVTDYETISVSRAVDINLLARETEEDPELLRKLNPSLHYSITPPGTKYALRIPAAKKQETQELLDSGKMLIEYYVYKIRSGDTLYALSRHYGVSVDMIQEYNPGIKADTLRIGSNVLIPALKEVQAYKGRTDDSSLNFNGTYIVKQGDTLWSIALAYNVQVETLAEKNNMEVNSILKLGKLLKVPAF